MMENQGYGMLVPGDFHLLPGSIMAVGSNQMDNLHVIHSVKVEGAKRGGE